jgi:polysaccharide export outer membrane protein
MHVPLNKRLTRWLLLLAVPLASACSSVAPGVQFQSYAGNPETAEGAVPEVTVITPELVKKERTAREKRTSDDIGKLVGTPSPYTIEKGDILHIVVWDHPELTSGGGDGVVATDVGAAVTPSSGFTVDHQGQIQFPYAGEIKVAGLTEDQARRTLAKKLAHYIRDPRVTLRVKSYRSKRVYVDGEVRTPGLQAIDDIPMTLTEAINRAGGFLPTADQSQILLSRNGQTYRISVPELVQNNVNPNSIMLASGDVVRVVSREDSKVFVSGEVNAPRALTMRNGRLTLNEALGETGGISPVSGDASQVYVIRRNQDEPTVYRLDANAPGAMALAEGFELQPKDVIYVAATPLMNWHRTISALLPGALSSAVSAGSTASKP